MLLIFEMFLVALLLSAVAIAQQSAEGNHVEPFINVGRRFVSVNCSSILSPAYPCSAAFDGRLTVGNEWASNGAVLGSWIQVTFDAVYTLTFLRVMQRYSASENSREIQITFDGTRELTMLLARTYGASHTDYNGQIWNELEVDDVITSTAKIEVTAVYTSSYNGFSEIEFYIGTNPCPPLYTLVGIRCFRYDLQELLSWEAARLACADDHAYLITMAIEGERDEIVEWMLRSFDMEVTFWTAGRLSGVNGTWLWGNGEAYWLDWEPSQPDVGDVIVLKTEAMQLASASRNDTNRYICEYSSPTFISNVGSSAMFDWYPIQDRRRATCMTFAQRQLSGKQVTLVWHTDVFSKVRVLLWRKTFTVDSVCGNNTITMMTSTSTLNMAGYSCQPFCGILKPCWTQQIKEDVEILECACPTDECRNIALHFHIAGGPYPPRDLEICHLDIIYLNEIHSD